MATATLEQGLSQIKLGQTEVRPIALMLLDLQMPRKNGIQVVKAIKDKYSQLKQQLQQ
jgi:CheY-like chemotaxis protein